MLSGFDQEKADRLHHVCHSAIQEFGFDCQLSKAQEEATELALALAHLRGGRGSIESVAEEAADIIIMLVQLRMMLGFDVDYFVSKKMDRLEALIAKHRSLSDQNQPCP
jgi:NTP pyrophosphatase (non-canonical NTP hydrolase)